MKCSDLNIRRWNLARIEAHAIDVRRCLIRPIAIDQGDVVQRHVPDAEPVFDIRNGMTGANNPRWKGGKQEWVCKVCGDTFVPRSRTNRTCPKCAAKAHRDQALRMNALRTVRASGPRIVARNVAVND